MEKVHFVSRCETMRIPVCGLIHILEHTCSTCSCIFHNRIGQNSVSKSHRSKHGLNIQRSCCEGTQEVDCNLNHSVISDDKNEFCGK